MPSEEKKRLKWNIHEAVILLDGYLELLQTRQPEQPKTRIVKRISEDLRRMAINRGMEIDDIYRNENGISYQIQSMDSAYKGEKIHIPATRLFVETVELYRIDREKYFKILEEAKHMAAPKQDEIASVGSFQSEEFLVRTERIKSALAMKGMTSVVCRELAMVAEKCDLEASGFRTVSEYAEKMFGISKVTTNQYVRIGKAFLTDDYRVDERLPQSLTVGHMMELLSVADTAEKVEKLYMDGILVDGMSTKEIREHLRAVCQGAQSIPTMRNVIPHDWIFDNKTPVSSYSMSVETSLVQDGTPSFDLTSQAVRRKAIDCLAKLEVALEQLEIDAEDVLEELRKLIMDADNREADVSAEVNTAIAIVLKQHYEYGFKYDSMRELMRFRQFADAMGIYLPEDDEVLKGYILSSGIVIGDKVYCKNDDMVRELQSIVDDVFSSGAEVIYYESLFENEQKWMDSHVITSPDMLKEYLQKMIVGCSFSKKFMNKGDRRSEKEAVTDELKRVWGAGAVESVDSLRNRLPYIPMGNIWRVISGNDLFALASEGEYLFIDRFRITVDEEEDILDFVDGRCKENGFASLSDVPLGDIEEENYELTRLVIHNAIYKKVLSGKYRLNGKILTKENSEIDAVMLLKQYIKDKDECTFDEVADKVIELTGGTNRQYAFQALYDDMVRVDRNLFVVDRLVDFSVNEIDNVLSEFITDGFRAVRDVTTFVMFPLCGQYWNHYLLESFCYKYSKKYSLHVMNFNDKNAGIIAEKGFNKKYNEMLAIALVRANVELSTEMAGQYLFDAGYMAKRKYAKLEEIVQLALELRREGR